ncbi:MAG: hypothetical protein ACO3JL_21315, partial [Myxococcota bacterium]
IALVDVLVDKQKKLEEGLLVLPMMQAAVRRLPDDVDLAIEALVVEALVDNERHLKREGAKRTERAFALALSREPVSPTLIARAGNLHVILLYLTGQYPAAIAALQRTRSALVSSSAHPHIRLAYLDNSLGLAHWASGDIEEAERAFASAIEVIEAQRAPHSHETLWAAPLGNLAALALQQGHLDLAAQRATQVDLMLDRTVGPNHPRHAYTDEVLALVAAAEGKYAEARRILRAWRVRHRDREGHELAISAALLELVVQLEATRGKAVRRFEAAISSLAPESETGVAERQVSFVAAAYLGGDDERAQLALAAARDHASQGHLSPSTATLLEAMGRVISGGSCEEAPTWHPLSRLVGSACRARR